MVNFKDKRVYGFLEWLKENQVNVTKQHLDEFLKRRLIESATPNEINDNREYYRNIYLNTSHWKDLRKRKLQIVAQCECCPNTKHLDVHHQNYKNLYDVELSDLRVLCRSCHHKLHKAVEGFGVKGKRKAAALEKQLDRMLPSSRLQRLRGRLFRMARKIKKTFGVDVEPLLRPPIGFYEI